MRKSPFINLLHLLPGLCLFVSASALAQTSQETPTETVPEQRIYDVEVILFKNKSVPKGHEVNLPTPAATHTPDTIDLFDPKQVEAAAAKGFSILQPADLRLLDVVQKIVKSSRYDLLAHIGWRQPGLDKAHAIPVWVHGGKIFDQNYSSIDQTESGVLNSNERTQAADNGSSQAALTAAPSGASQLTTTPVPQRGLYELDGAITIILARYLHTQADLVLRKPATLESLIQRVAQDKLPDTQPGERILLNYALKERRRMRSKRLHYLDSPQFGMLVLITQYQKPQDETVTEPDERSQAAVNVSQ